MNSLVFLLVRSLKNTILEVLRKPARLVLWLLTLGGLAAIFFLSSLDVGRPDRRIDLIWLKGVLFLLILLFTVLAIRKGLSSGDVIFDMSDVNLLFTSPVNPRLILMYGIIRMARMSILAGFFIPFQASSLRGFGIGPGGMLLLWLGFIVAVSLLQIISLLVYVLTNGRPERKRATRLIAIGAHLPLIYVIGIQFDRQPGLVAAIEQTLRLRTFAMTPVAGWAAEGTLALIAGNIRTGLTFYGLIVLVGAALITYIARSNPDFYEDVLVATETAFEKKRKLREGQINVEPATGQATKVTRTGIGGSGASAIFRKHLRESFRANRLGLWSPTSIWMMVAAIALSLFFRDDDDGIMLLLQLMMWLQVFLIGTGRGLKELYSHYIYLIPERSFAKIVWSSLETALKVLVESVVIFGAAAAIMGESALLAASATVVYTLFSLLLLGINYLSLRWTDTSISSGLLIFIYILAVILIMMPGLIAAIIIGLVVGGTIGQTVPDAGFLVGLIVLAVWELFAALGCFALSRGILDRCDMPTIKTGS